MNSNPKLSREEIIEKAESNPPQKLYVKAFLANFYIFGVMRFRYANMKKVYVALGYDKSLSYEYKIISSLLNFGWSAFIIM